jgi:DNA repair and recombination protein RAD54B
MPSVAAYFLLSNIQRDRCSSLYSACKAQRRVILSGTPIQNDLDELYAVVSFVAPGFFGSFQLHKSVVPTF